MFINMLKDIDPPETALKWHYVQDNKINAFIDFPAYYCSYSHYLSNYSVFICWNYYQEEKPSEPLKPVKEVSKKML